jgi:hypothetical protein
VAHDESARRSGGDSERKIEVKLDVAGNAATATLVLTLPNGRRATRTLHAATCDEAVDAAALVAAVTLDPTASTAPTTPPGADAGATGGTGTGGNAPRPATSAVPPPERGIGGSGEKGEPPSKLSGGPFIAGETVSGPAPSALVGVGAGFIGVWNRGSVLSPALRLSGAYFPGKKYEQIDGTAYFSLYAGTLDVCPLRFGSDAVALFGCGTFTAGVLNAEGRQTNAQKDNHRPWLVLGGTALLEVRPVGPLELELLGTVGSPLLRDTFQFDCAEGAADCKPDVFHVVSGLSVQVRVAVGVFFR